MDLQRAWADDWETRLSAWARAVAVLLTGLALGAAAGSALVWSAPATLPGEQGTRELAAQITSAPPTTVDQAGAPARLPHEDWPVDGFWNHLLLGHNSEPNVLTADWLSPPGHTNPDLPSLAEIEASLRAGGWIIDGTTPLTAHDSSLAIAIRGDPGRLELAVRVRPYPTPAAPLIAAALAGAGIALLWLLWRRHLLACKGRPGAKVGVVGMVLLVPSTLAVYAAGGESGWWGEDAANLWESARFYVDITPFGLFMNAGVILLVTDAILLLVRPRGWRPDEIVLAA
ncbi:hypothetical protein [Phytomonospora endophytica]|uniref:Uncharacterized protein n=1 Tax=Phytomonospora endophytica TaxID=714109 RepID=A0A841FXG8_9ACTN|nr:hypothetical protein [Phytomonospora endophytica]MBB6038047.1 hypothetical protein [Phytomonospora endophytica]GIG67489.1 hypothetical protein Pen01_37840 [Phytomonospora endophytica]